MANEIQTTTTSTTQWLEPSLPAKLSGLLDRDLGFNDLPVVGPNTAGGLTAWLKANSPPLPTEGQIETMLAKLSIALPKARAGEAEAGERLSIYTRALADVPLPFLRTAFDRLIKSARFFPTVAEVRQAAAPEMNRWSWRKGQADKLLLKHRREWTEPTEMADPAEVKALLRRAA